MLTNRLIGVLSAMSVVASATGGLAVKADSNTMRDMTTMEVIEDMGIGINLGNTFESCGDWIAQWGDGTPNAYETA